jgi:hypothetical protein
MIQSLFGGGALFAAAIAAVPVVPANAVVCHTAPTPRLGSVPTLLGANALLGGLTAAIRAAAGGRNPVQPFLLGALGGAAHYSGKYIALAPRGISQFAGLTVSSFGTSIVANAGAGVGITDDLYIPLGPARQIRAGGFHVALNAYESATLIHLATGPDRRFDLASTLAFGSIVLRDRRTLKSVYGETSQGATSAAVVVVSDQATNPGATLVHEVVHARQFWFLQEAIGRPIDAAIRSHAPGGRFLPEWLELGVTVPLLIHAEWLASSRSQGPTHRAKEYEAELIECRKFR